MRISCCTRCDQLIEYEKAFEGEEVLCPACDNITRLVEIPEDKLPPLERAESEASEGDGKRSSRMPLRISAEELPKPSDDLVAPMIPSDDEGKRGPDQARKDAAKERAEKGEEKPETGGLTSQQEKARPSVPLDKIPEELMPEIRIVSGPESVSFFGDDDSDENEDEDGIQISQGRAIAIVCALAMIVLAIKYWPFGVDDAERSRQQTVDLRAEIARQTEAIRAQAEPLPPNPRPPRSDLTLLPQQAIMTMTNRAMVPVSASMSGDSSTPTKVEVYFPLLPKTIRVMVPGFRDEAYLTYVGSALAFPFRLFDNTVVDFRTLGYAIKRGMIAFDDEWQVLGGLVVDQRDEGVLLRLDQRYFPAGGQVFIVGYPRESELQENQGLGVIVKAIESREVELKGGQKIIVKAYDFGLTPSPKMIEVVQEQAMVRDRINREAKNAIARKKADEESAKVERKKAENDRRAVAYLRKRMKDGSASAQYSLGLRYLKGAGVPESREEGIRLLKAAAEQDHNTAKRKLKELGQ